MNINYEILTLKDVSLVRDLCNELMTYQKSKAYIHPEWFDKMCFESRFIPSYNSAKENFLIVAKANQKIIGYAYSNISSKYTYSGGFATLQPVDFFDFSSVKYEEVGCLSQFYLKEEYRNTGIGSSLFNKSMNWLKSKQIDSIFIFVSNGNKNAINFYLNKGFFSSHDILDGFITVLRSN